MVASMLGRSHAGARRARPPEPSATVPPGRHRSYGAAADARKGESPPIMATLARTWQRFTHDDQPLFLLAVAVGAAGGYGAVAFEPDRAEPVTARDLVPARRSPWRRELSYAVC
jgi:hypothetical protein